MRPHVVTMPPPPPPVSLSPTSISVCVSLFTSLSVSVHLHLQFPHPLSAFFSICSLSFPPPLFFFLSPCCTLSVCLTLPSYAEYKWDHFALPQNRSGLLGTGTGGEGDERVKARPRVPPEKDRETVDRRQNNGSVKAVSLRHCQRLVHCAIAVSTAVLRTMSDALLLSNNSKRKTSNFRSPAPPPYS